MSLATAWVPDEDLDLTEFTSILSVVYARRTDLTDLMAMMIFV